MFPLTAASGFFTVMTEGSSFAPDQSPQKCAFKMAVGKNEMRAASKMIVAVAIILFRNNGISGKTKNAHGRSSGRLLPFAPVKSAAAKIECHKSEMRFDFRARKLKSIAASA